MFRSTNTRIDSMTSHHVINERATAAHAHHADKLSGRQAKPSGIINAVLSRFAQATGRQYSELTPEASADILATVDRKAAARRARQAREAAEARDDALYRTLFGQRD